jgi:agmatinase
MADTTREPGPVEMHRDGADWQTGGGPSFLNQPICISFEDLDRAGADVVVLGSPWDGTMGAPPGTRHAPAAIRSAEYTGAKGGDWTHAAVRVNPLDHLTIVDFGDAPVVPGSVEHSFEVIRHYVRKISGRGAFPLIFGGDHAVTWPHVLGVTDIVGTGAIGVIHFDAHCDTWPLEDSEYTSHGSGMRQIVDGGLVKPEHFIQVGLRSSTDRETLAYMESIGMRSHWMAEIEDRGLDTVVDIAVSEAQDGTEAVFLTVDIDVCDPAHAPATGAPEPGGLTGAELFRSVRRICHETPVIGMDIVEVSPPYEAGNRITAILAHRTAVEALTGLAMRRLGLPPRYVHPRPARGP